MGIKMVMPGVYEFDPETPDGRDDFERRERLLQYSGILPEHQHTKRLSTFEMVEGSEEGFEAACEFIRGEIDPPLLLLYGEPGRSKTHLAMAIGLASIAQLKPTLYYYVGDLLDDLRAGIRAAGYQVPGDHNPDATGTILKRCKNTALLILDDMGIEKPTDYVFEKLDTIVNHRWENHLPTVITANTLELSDRIIDQCREGRVVQLVGESYREIIQRRKAETRAEYPRPREPSCRVRRGAKGSKK